MATTPSSGPSAQPAARPSPASVAQDTLRESDRAPAAAGRLVLTDGARPLPEYELVRLLGRGGFGEVWKALGPGGFHVALKFIRLGDRAGAIELRALEIMKEVHHPNVLGMFGAWQRDGLLILAMELADATLLDRLHEALAAGTTGIPEAELMEQMEEAAKGIDHLNGLDIQHRDIKPQNLLLAGGGVKVADFGLAKVLEHTVASASGAMTPAYAAPEFFKGEATRSSDQYSLAVSYCQLRGKRLPFQGNTAQLLAGHLMQPPDLTMLPEAERPAVARALSKKPEDRWPSCRAFVKALSGHAADAAAPSPDSGQRVETPGLDSNRAPAAKESSSPITGIGSPTTIPPAHADPTAPRWPPRRAGKRPRRLMGSAILWRSWRCASHSGCSQCGSVAQAGATFRSHRHLCAEKSRLPRSTSKRLPETPMTPFRRGPIPSG